jgi:hypothetical protein
MGSEVQAKPCSTCIYGSQSGSTCTAAELEAEIVARNGFCKDFRVCHQSRTGADGCLGIAKRMKLQSVKSHNA